MIYAKYEFLPNEIPALQTEEGNILIDGQYVNMGHLLKTEGTYDENLNEITPPIFSDKVAIDVLWNNEPDPAWEAYRVYPTSHSHWIGGMEEYYIDKQI